MLLQQPHPNFQGGVMSIEKDELWPNDYFCKLLHSHLSHCLSVCVFVSSMRQPDDL